MHLGRDFRIGIPSKSTIWRNVQKYLSSGTSHNRNKGNSGRRRVARSEENVAAVRNLLEENPENVSARRNGLGISRSSFNRITKFELRWHPYRIHIRHSLLQTDFPRRVRFSEWWIRQCQRVHFTANVVIGDEAGFMMNGKVNTHNIRRYAPKGDPPAFNFDRNDSRAKLTVWVGLCGNGVIVGPYFFDGNVDGIAYLQMLDEYVFPQLSGQFGDQYVTGVFQTLWWAQDGAPAHRLIAVRDRLNATFPNRVIGLQHDIEWPPRSPDLTPCDFFLWGYLKNKVFTTPPANLATLRQRIIDEVDDLRRQPDIVRNAMREMHKRATLCVQINGGHVEGQGE